MFELGFCTVLCAWIDDELQHCIIDELGHPIVDHFPNFPQYHLVAEPFHLRETFHHIGASFYLDDIRQKSLFEVWNYPVASAVE
jgi:hypothetical protein